MKKAFHVMMKTTSATARMLPVASASRFHCGDHRESNRYGEDIDVLSFGIKGSTNAAPSEENQRAAAGMVPGAVPAVVVAAFICGGEAMNVENSFAKSL